MNNIIHIIIIVIIIITIIVIGILTTYLEKEKIEEEIPKDLIEFLNNDERKITGIKYIKTNEDFNKLEMKKDIVYFYFPNECPSYKEDILLYEKTEHGDKYYLPEQFSLLKFPANNYYWTKKFTGTYFTNAEI